MLLDEAQVRREKLAKLEALGMGAYPVDPARTMTCGDALASFEALAASGERVALAGRLLTIRVHGGMMFADLVEESGKLQLAFKQDDIGEEVFGRFGRIWWSRGTSWRQRGRCLRRSAGRSR